MEDNAIIMYYNGCGSVRETARAAGLNPHTVRRILTVNGVIANPTYTAIVNLAEQGMSAAEIAQRLHLSRSTVYNYLPYAKGRYKSDNPTDNALRIRAMREKHKEAQK